MEQPKAKEPARYARMRETIDQACEDASTAEDFRRALYRQGYIFGSDPTESMQRFGHGMVDEPCGFIGWEKNTIYLP